MSNDYFDYYIPYTTVRIENTQREEVGTGFLYRVECPEIGKNKAILLLISNKHVLQGDLPTRTEFTIELNRKKMMALQILETPYHLMRVGIYMLTLILMLI